MILLLIYKLTETLGVIGKGQGGRNSEVAITLRGEELKKRFKKSGKILKSNDKLL